MRLAFYQVMRMIGVILLVFLVAGYAYWVLPRPCPDLRPVLVFTLHEYPEARITGFRDINADGEIVGYFQTDDPPASAHALLVRGGANSVIDPPGSSFDRRAFAINDSDLVALSYDGNNAMLWDGAIYTPVAYPGASGTVIRGLNNHGDISGEFTDASGAVQAFVRIGGVFTHIPFSGAVRASARGIANDGTAVGYYEMPGGVRHCFVRDPSGSITELSVAGRVSIMCGGLNNTGAIVGASIDPTGRAHAFVWRGGVFRHFDVPGAQDTVALGINDVGDIVGEVSFGGGFTDYAAPHRGFYTESFR